MAATLASAFAEVAGDRLEHACGLDGPTWSGTATDPAVAAAFSRAQVDLYRKIASRLVRRTGRPLPDAEDAIQDVLIDLYCEHRELFCEPPDTWAGRVFEAARFRLRSGGMRPNVCSLEALGGDPPAAAAAAEEDEPPIARSRDAAPVVLPGPGERFSSEQMIEALRRFHRHHVRPPKLRDCRAANRLPSPAEIRREFGSFRRLLMAAGMADDRYRHRQGRWTPREAAIACVQFKDRHGWWPCSGDVRRFPGELPSSSTMMRFFGSTRSCFVQRGSECILGML